MSKPRNKKYSIKYLQKSLGTHPANFNRDNYGQVLKYRGDPGTHNEVSFPVYTGVFRWSDGTYHNHEKGYDFYGKPLRKAKHKGSGR